MGQYPYRLVDEPSPLAQLVEHRSYEPKVTGSTPVGRIRLSTKTLNWNLSIAVVAERLRR